MKEGKAGEKMAKEERKKKRKKGKENIFVNSFSFWTIDQLVKVKTWF